jgi:sec-independent protein translocase protein TatB
MEFLGIGPSELLFIIIIALIVLGPKDMQKTGRTIGKWMRKIITSDGWKFFQQTSREIQTLPNRLMREAALDELKELQKDLKKPLDVNSGPSQSNSSGVPQPMNSDVQNSNPSSEPSNTILPSPPPASAPSSASSDDEVKNA